jgi:hypothetical protein
MERLSAPSGAADAARLSWNGYQRRQALPMWRGCHGTAISAIRRCRCGEVVMERLSAPSGAADVVRLSWNGYQRHQALPMW